MKKISIFLLVSYLCLGCPDTASYYSDVKDIIYLNFFNSDSDEINIRVKKFDMYVGSNYNYIPNTIFTGIFDGLTLKIPSITVPYNDYLKLVKGKCIYCENKIEVGFERNRYTMNPSNISIFFLEFTDKWQTVKYAETIFSIINRQSGDIQFVKDPIWDTSLDFISQAEIRTPVKSNPPGYPENITRIYTATFSRTNIPLNASELRNFRLWNNSKNNIKVKIYKVVPMYGEEYYYVGNAYPYWYSSFYIMYYNTWFRSKEFANIFWQTSATWEKDIASGGVGTIFHSTLAYTGPFKIEIYDKDTGTKLLDDKVRYPFFDEEELIKYKDSKQAFKDGMRIRTKLDWYKKAELPSTMLNISTISNYPNEFYAEYKGN